MREEAEIVFVYNNTDRADDSHIKYLLNFINV